MSVCLHQERYIYCHQCTTNYDTHTPQTWTPFVACEVLVRTQVDSQLYSPSESPLSAIRNSNETIEQPLLYSNVSYIQVLLEEVDVCLACPLGSSLSWFNLLAQHNQLFEQKHVLLTTSGESEWPGLQYRHLETILETTKRSSYIDTGKSSPLPSFNYDTANYDTANQSVGLYE